MNQDDVREVFDYNTKTGDLIRKSLNKITGSIDQSGYKRTKYKGKNALCHRLIYIWHHGQIPDHYHIDHIDHNRSNNRIENLQALTPYDNIVKKKSPVKRDRMVYKTAKGWSAKITIDVGTYDTEDEAVKAIEDYKKMVESSVDNSVYPVNK